MIRLVLFFCLLSLHAHDALATGEPRYRLVFGSFATLNNARNWSEHISSVTLIETGVQKSNDLESEMFRVASPILGGQALNEAYQQAKESGMPFWRLLVEQESSFSDTFVEQSDVDVPAVNTVSSVTRKETNVSVPATVPAPEQKRQQEFNYDLGLQSRSFAHSGNQGQATLHPSLSLQMEYHRAWNEGQDAITFTPFVRYDAQDSRRSHADIRELYWNHVGSDWEFNAGIQQVFWGVTEFNHLVDIINQTDFVEDPDEEDRLGQPLVSLSLVRSWGILDFMLMPGFRERTFPGEEGRLSFGLKVDTKNATYASGAGRHHTDAAVRWSHYMGPVVFGLYHFSGTNRDPQLRVFEAPSGQYVLRPHYTTIDQTGLDAQAIVGDWIFKVEAISRSGEGDRYQATTFGFEKSIVGIFNSRVDLGLVAEYMYDDRGDRANTLFEHDLALGTRWSLNDPAGSQALLGLIWDTQTHETIFSLEASRRLGSSWKLMLEGRAFGGGTNLHTDSVEDSLQALRDFRNKTAPLQRDDYIQLELTRFL